MARKRSEETLQRLANRELHITAKRLQKFMDDHNLSQSKLAKILGIAQSSINSAFLTGNEVPKSVILGLKDIYHYDIINDVFTEHKDLITIQFEHSSAAAGTGILLDDEPLVESLTFDKKFLKSILPLNTNFNELVCVTASG